MQFQDVNFSQKKVNLIYFPENLRECSIEVDIAEKKIIYYSLNNFENF